jgi:hypothetical protein
MFPVSLSEGGGRDPIVAAGSARLGFGMAMVWSSGPSVIIPVAASSGGAFGAAAAGGTLRLGFGIAMVWSSGPRVTIPRGRREA